MTPKVVLTVAGSDSGGCAGIQADLRTFAALGVHGASALSAVTAQHTRAVVGVVSLDPSFVVAQVEAVLDDLGPVAVKTGMLATPDTVAAVAELAAAGRLPNLVVDPVLVSTSGHALMDEGGALAYAERLLPHALVATPNLAEAAALVGRDPAAVADVETMAQMATELLALGCRYVVVKGGHLEPGTSGSPDVVAGPDGVSVLRAARVATTNDHGSGCTLSAAIAARLAVGTSPEAAITFAKAFVQHALCGAASWRLGAGRGPLDHLGWSAATPFEATPAPTLERWASPPR